MLDTENYNIADSGYFVLSVAYFKFSCEWYIAMPIGYNMLHATPLLCINNVLWVVSNV